MKGSKDLLEGALADPQDRHSGRSVHHRSSAAALPLQLTCCMVQGRPPAPAARTEGGYD